jgi:hypothetical protein
MAFRRRLFCRGIIVSDEGFSVSPSMHGSTWYRERGRRAEFYSDECIDGTLSIGLPPDAAWITRSGKEPFAPGERELVIRRVRAAVEFGGWTIRKGDLEFPASEPVTSPANTSRSNHPA